MTVIDFNNPPGILCLTGLPGAGKSTLARQWVAKDPDNRLRINYDDLRIELYGEGWKFNRPEEDAMKAEAFRRAKTWLGVNPYEKAVIIDNLNLTTNARQPWISLARELGVPIDIHEMDTNVQDCVRHDRYRGKGRVGEAVINRWALTTGWIDWTVYKQNFVIVDMDGTLADTSTRVMHVRPPDPKPEGWKKNWPAFFKNCDLDEPIRPILDLVTELGMSYHILVVSGRPIDLTGIQTEEWLRKWKVPYEFLFMRAGGDGRQDTVIKQEILDFLPKDRIAFVLDDRNDVVKMWRDNGLVCLQVAPGDF